jgi:hypothetical protein
MIILTIIGIQIPYSLCTTQIWNSVFTQIWKRQYPKNGGVRKANSKASETLQISLVYIINSNGPRTDPWGTPYLMVLIIKRGHYPIAFNILLSVNLKNNLLANKCQATNSIMIEFCEENFMIISNAFDRSKKNPHCILFFINCWCYLGI